METFFGHENHPYPPSLFDRGNLRSTKKSDLLSILAQETESREHFTSFDVKTVAPEQGGQGGLQPTHFSSFVDRISK